MTDTTGGTDGGTDGGAAASEDGGWGDWISPGPAAALGVVGVAAAALVDAVTGGDDADEEASLSSGDRQYSDEELDVDHDGDVDMDDVTQQTTENLWTGIQTGNLIMSSEAAGQAQLDAIDAIYGND